MGRFSIAKRPADDPAVLELLERAATGVVSLTHTFKAKETRVPYFWPVLPEVGIL